MSWKKAIPSLWAQLTHKTIFSEIFCILPSYYGEAHVHTEAPCSAVFAMGIDCGPFCCEFDKASDW